jgi:hypothetical protein
MKAHVMNPILNVGDFAASVRWFETLGWEKAWDWGDPPTFGGVRSGADHDHPHDHEHPH